MFFNSFPPFYTKRVDHTCLSSLSRSLSKDVPICSSHSLQKSDHEQIAPVAFYKRATMTESIPSIFKKE